MNEFSWDKNIKKCEKCKSRFKCYTTNTSNRPEQLQGINFEVAKCCIRCKHSKFKTGKDPQNSAWQNGETIGMNSYLRVGSCMLHKVMVHQFSVCSEFIQKKTDNLTYEVNSQIEDEVCFINHNYRLPRYCIVDKKVIT